MLNNVFSHGGRGGGAGVLYGLSDFDHTGAERLVKPVVLYGSPEVVMQVIDASRWAQRYTSGVLSFKETELPAQVKRQIIAEHLAVTFPGLDPSRVAAVYIEHRDKNILELHYWIANTDLESGKRLEPYWHRADCSRFRRWVRSVNARWNLADPEDPKNRRTAAKPKKNQAESRKQLHAGILDELKEQMLQGAVRSRADVERWLVANDWQISRRTKNFLSIKRPGIELPIRLTGEIFRADWSGGTRQEMVDQLHHEYRATRLQRLRQAVAELVPLLRKRATINAKRYRSSYSAEPFVAQLEQACEDLAEEVERARPRGPMEALRASLGALQQQVGQGTSLTRLNARTRQNLKRSEPEPAANPTPPTHRPRGPRL